MRALSGLAGSSSGIGAELRQGCFSNLASQIIVPGIDIARAEIRRDILARRGQPAAVCTVEAALSDVARYHEACSLNAGIERSGMAVSEVVNPGLRSLNASLSQLNLAQRLAKRLGDETVDVSGDLQLVENVIGSPVGPGGAARGAAARQVMSLGRGDDLVKSLGAAIEAAKAATAPTAPPPTGPSPRRPRRRQRLPSLAPAPDGPRRAGARVLRSQVHERQVVEQR